VRNITIKDVAKTAGVSTATISRVLNENGYVSEDVRQHVLQTVKELNYLPNAVARSLKQERTRGIGMIIPDMTNPYFMKVIRTLQRQLLEEKYHLLYMETESNSSKEAEALQFLLSMRVEGIILAGAGGNQDLLKRITNSGTPVVLLDRNIPGFSADLVMEDNHTPVQEAMDYLIRKYGNEIAVINGPLNISTAKERSEAVLDTIKHSHAIIKEEWICEGDFSRDSGRSACHQIMASSNPPLGVFSANNEMTFGFYLGLKDLNIPLENIEVVSFGDLDFSPLIQAKLAVVQQKPESIGEASAQLMLERLNNVKMQVQKRIFIPELVH
jgi:LacI family transcriptional regulator